MKILLTAYNQEDYFVHCFLKSMPGAFVELKELEDRHVDILLPLSQSSIYPTINKGYCTEEIPVLFGEKTHLISIVRVPLSDHNVFFVSHSAFFSKDLGKKFIHDNFPNVSDSWEPHLYLFFSLCVAEFISFGFNTYDVINVLDSEGGLIPTILKKRFGVFSPPIVLSVFNVKKQIIGSNQLAEELYRVLNIQFKMVGEKEHNYIDFNAHGIMKSDFISTVSRSLDKDVLTKFIPALLSVLEKKPERIVGINLGFEYKEARDVFRSSLGAEIHKEKLKFKSKLLRNFDLPAHKLSLEQPIFAYDYNSANKDTPLVQKVLAKLPEKAGLHIIFVDRANYVSACRDFPSSNCFCVISDFGHLMFKHQIPDVLLKLLCGIDFFVVLDKVPMRSDFIALVNYCGGLLIGLSEGVAKDMVREGRNGFLFNSYNVRSFEQKFNKALSIYNSLGFEEMLEVATSMRFTWSDTAKRYFDLYEKALQLRAHEIESQQKKATP